ncbi:MAG TPA: YkgJ family cysteine cluster protein [Candidatus Binataceae bacterium]|nr:YkgJ family cysteine cluster protein [Candidatus Binataceae bacterium]
MTDALVPAMDRSSAFSYLCNRCGRCCHNQVVALSPYDLVRLARAAGVSTGEAIRRYTIRRGSILKFDASAGCAALEGAACTLHRGRPLACRLYPLGMEHRTAGGEEFAMLEPARGSLGVYGGNGTVEDFLEAQGTEAYLRANLCYAELLGVLRERIRRLVDFEIVEPREFWRVAAREALAETGFDPNPMIDALFDPDSLGCAGGCGQETVVTHVNAIKTRIGLETDAAMLAAAAVLLAVSLGYSPAVVR